MERLQELEMVAKRAEETFDRNTIEVARERFRESHSESFPETSDRRKQKRLDVEHGRKRRLGFLRPRSEKVDDDSDENGSDDAGGSSEPTFLNRLRIRRRSVKLLSFLSGKTGDKAQEERANRLLRMYVPDKGSKGPNTISIHHTSRDRRFWKLRNRRRSSSA